MNGTELAHFHAPAPQKKNTALTIVLIVLAVLIAAFGVVSWLALNDPLAGKGYDNVTPSDSLPKTFIEAAVKQSECSFSKDDVNGYLAYLFQKHNAGTAKKNVKLLAAAITGGNGNSVDLYLPVEYHSKRFGILLNVTPSLDKTEERLLFRVNTAHVGRLPVSVGWLLQKAESRLPSGLLLEGSTISCKNPTASVSVLMVTASAKLSEFRMENGILKTAASLQVSVG